MLGSDKSTDDIADLADRIERFDRAYSTPSRVKPSGERPKKKPVSPRERKIRRRVFAAMAVWGGLIYAVSVIQEWGRPLFLLFAATVVTVCVFGCYGFYLFYAEMGKILLRKFRGGRADD